MARDSQAALVALNRFGFGARGGASGDLVNAASDPRGFVKAELSRPNGVLLEMPGLLSTPALGEAVFAYQFEIKQARDAAAKGGRVISDWPGLKPANLYEGRGLAPTTDLRGVIKGVLRDHLGVAERVLAETVFPDSAPVKPMKDWWREFCLPSGFRY